MYGLRLRSQRLVVAAVHTGCILHNMLHTIDGYDIKKWEDDDIWRDIHPDEEVSDQEMHRNENENNSIANHVTLELAPIKAMINRPRQIKTVVIQVGSVVSLQR